MYVLQSKFIEKNGKKHGIVSFIYVYFETQIHRKIGKNKHGNKLKASFLLNQARTSSIEI